MLGYVILQRIYFISDYYGTTGEYFGLFWGFIVQSSASPACLSRPRTPLLPLSAQLSTAIANQPQQINFPTPAQMTYR